MSTVPTYKPLEIEVTDFGPIAKAKLDLRPLTVFVGPSNTGKSYLATLIYALHRFFGGYATEPDPQPRLNSSLFFQYPEIRRRYWDLSEKEAAMLLDWASKVLKRAREAGFSADFRVSVPDRVAALLCPMLRSVEEFSSDVDGEIARCFGSQRADRLIGYGKQTSRVLLKRHVSEPQSSIEPFTYELTVEEGNTTLTASIPDTVPIKIESVDNDPLYREKLKRLDLEIVTPVDSEDYDNRYAMRPLRDALVGMVGSSIVSPLERVAHYLPADRAGIMLAHSLVVTSLIQQSSVYDLHYRETSRLLSGVHVDFFEQLVGFGNSRMRGHRDGEDLARKLEEGLLNGEVRENPSSTRYPFYSYRPFGHREDILLVEASSMVSELAPVVLYLRHIVHPGDVLIVEEPESHLHPGMQAAFTRQLAAMVRAGVRVMLTTHSDYVLEELANLVRMSELPESQQAGLEGAAFALKPEEVGVWLFEPRKRPKGTVVKEIKLDKDAGTFPAGYGDVTEALYNKWVEIDSRIVENKPD